MSWVNKFTEMLFALNRKDSNIEGAYLLKQKHLPKSIFKYREVNTNAIKNLREDTIWLADPTSFNDPYDCAHLVDFYAIQKHSGADMLENYLSDRGSEIQLTEAQKKELLSSDDPMDALSDLLLEDEPEESKKILKEITQQATKKMYQDLTISNSKEISSSFKLCSFSERNDSMLMWSHYSSYHQGFCIEYDIEKIEYSDYRRRFLFPVIYSDDMFDATEHMKKRIEDDSFNNLYISKVALIKSKDWLYEKEWRLVFANGIMEKERPYHMGKAKSVYLGAKIKPEHQELIVSICSEKDIPIFKMTTNHMKFQLESVDLKDAEQHFFK